MTAVNCQIVRVGDEYIVPKLTVNPENGQRTVKWEISDGSDFTVWFPPTRSPLEGGNLFESKGSTLMANLLKGAAGLYEYSVHCHRNNHLARGNSSPPIMIIL